MGSGVLKKVREAYHWICGNYEAGDEVSHGNEGLLSSQFAKKCLNHRAAQIFLFGFSRGAYTARLVASLVCMLGVLEPKGTLDLFPQIFLLLCENRDGATRHGRERHDQLVRLLEKIRGARAQQLDARADGRLVQVLGLFETVSMEHASSRRSILVALKLICF